MPDLLQRLRPTDLDFLQRIARAWSLELSAQSFTEALPELASGMLDPELFAEIIDALPAVPAQAWKYLIAHQGKETWATFSREFGDLRPYGLAKRSREEPDLHPVNANEFLWYRGLIGRAFLNLSGTPQEYVFIPDEFLTFTSVPEQTVSEYLLPRPASEAEKKVPLLADDAILDDITELLASLRMNRQVFTEEENIPQRAYQAFLLNLLAEMEIISPARLPNPERVIEFLSLPRGAALLTLFTTWHNSQKINDLRMLPGLIFEGNWQNDPHGPRELLLQIVSTVSSTSWWSIPSLLSQIKAHRPDFQRPAGDYDSWFILEQKSREYLRGFTNWDKVDGALLRYLLVGPLHWLGVLDLARGERSASPLALRLSSLGTALLKDETPQHVRTENGSVTLLNNGTLLLNRDVPRPLRYQIARFCSPVADKKKPGKYRLTAESLAQASEQGLRPTQLLQILQLAHVKSVPQSISEALDRWEKYGPEVLFEPVTLLRLDKPELLPMLQKNPHISRYFGEVLNNKTVILKPGSAAALQQSLAELGLLTQVKISKDV
jgi:hypothetical protein